MPQYKNVQYGLRQYGLFQTGGTTGPGDGTKTRWRFIKSRFGAVRKGHTFWLYTHNPATIQGTVTKLRIKTNQGSWLQEETVQVTGKPLTVRLSSNVSLQKIVSGQLLE